MVNVKILSAEVRKPLQPSTSFGKLEYFSKSVFRKEYQAQVILNFIKQKEK